MAGHLFGYLTRHGRRPRRIFYGRPGKPCVDDRTVISGILHVLKTGCRWRNVPAAYGPPAAICNRHNRRALRGIWQRLFEKIVGARPVPDKLSIGSTHRESHRSKAGSRRGAGRSDRPLARWSDMQDALPGR
ncbi:transposase [Sphingomonas sanguinis]|uniref:transposase n=1 Tax=Sphingomonas sanguinis TaxID=33051 RepID=UPI003A0FE3B1